MGGNSGGQQTTRSEPADWIKPFLGYGNALGGQDIPNQAYNAFQNMKGIPDPAGQIAVLQGLNTNERAGMQSQLQGANRAANQMGRGVDAAMGMLNPRANPFVRQSWNQAMSPRVRGYQSRGYDPATYNAVGVGNAQRMSADEINAMGSPGMGQLLSGEVNTGIYDPVSEAMTQRTLQSFQDEVLPMLRQEAQGAGQLGSSMHDRAVGIAGSRLMDSLAAQNAALYANAGEAAQQDLRLGSQLGAGFTSQNAAAINAARANNQNAANQFRLSNAAYRNQARGANTLARNQAKQFGAGARNEQGQFNANLGASQRAGDQNLFSSIYSPTMGQSTAALGMLPGLAQGAMLPGQVQQVIGQQQRGNQEQLNAQQVAMGQARRNQWMNDVGQWGGIVGPLAGFGGGNTRQQVPGGSTVAGIAGGALTGAAAGSVIPGLGTGFGALLGGIAGGWG